MTDEQQSLSWDEYFYNFAKLAATKSKDTTKVGAALIGPDGEIRMTGFNGPPRGVADSPDRRERPRKYLFSSHSEANVLLFCAREGVRTKGCDLYVTHHPCAACARSIIQAGIGAVHIGPGTTSMPEEEFEAAREMFAEAGITVRHIDEGKN